MKADISWADRDTFDELCLKALRSGMSTTEQIHDFVYAEIRKTRNQKLIALSRAARFKEYLWQSLRRGVVHGRIQKLPVVGKVATWKAVVNDASGI